MTTTQEVADLAVAVMDEAQAKGGTIGIVAVVAEFLDGDEWDMLVQCTDGRQWVQGAFLEEAAQLVREDEE